ICGPRRCRWTLWTWRTSAGASPRSSAAAGARRSRCGSRRRMVTSTSSARWTRTPPPPSRLSSEPRSSNASWRTTPARRIRRALLAARLVDVLVGDWDRHPEQWRWARFDEAGVHVWRPIPRDRDQAFSRLDGLLPWIARYYHPDIVSFGDRYPDLVGLTWNGRALDRRVLNDLEKPVWDSVAAALQAGLSDTVIDRAVHRL